MKKDPVTRIGDMHPNRALKVFVGNGGDMHLLITQDGMVIGDIDTGSEKDREAQVEFCVSGGRSQNTLRALVNLMEAMEKDNVEWPI